MRLTRACGAALALAVAVGSLVGCGAGPAERERSTASSSAPLPPPATHGALVPDHGAYLGLYYGDGSRASTDAAIGRTPRLHLTYYGWHDAWATSAATRRDLAGGRIPLVNWEPAGVHFADIVSGRDDDLIARRAEQAKALHQRFFLDFAAEMNEDEGWGGHDPALYIAAYRHLHDVFTQHGATNVVWVWAPNDVDTDGAPPATAYYPGAAYVDWTGMDGYNWGTSGPDYGWESFTEVFTPLYDDLARLGKPIIIGEMASDDRGGSKAAWISTIVPTLTARFPDIHALVWFDIEKERHWQFRSSPSSAAAFRAMAADPYFAA